MKKVADFIIKHKIAIVIVAFLLLIPSIYGMQKTKINYDILVYLPDDIETIEGQNILKDDFGIGSFAFVMVDNMSNEDMIELQEQFKEIDTVSQVLSEVDILGSSFPSEFIPDEVRTHLETEDSKLMLVTFKDSLSGEDTLDAIATMRDMVDSKAKIGGMSATVLDTMNLSNSEMALYVIVAVILCIIILLFATDSYVVPFLLLSNIGMAILYNMGTNIFLGEISYITKSISAVLQLGVTTDFSIFLYHKYEQQKKDKDKQEAMKNAIVETFKSVIGSSLTTIAGFLALCSMQLTLGSDIGIVMAKGVFFGLICVLTIFPCLLLVFDKQVEKTKHKNFFPQFKKLQSFSIKHTVLILICFLLILFPAWYGNKNVKVYYNLDKTLPETLQSCIANSALKDEFNIVSPQIILVDKDLSYMDLKNMTDDLKELEGIDLVLAPKEVMDVLPSYMLPSEVESFIESDQYQMILVNSTYEMATNELNEQIDTIDELVKKYDKKAIVAGEGPLMKDLTQISDQDFKNVNYTSIFVIFILMVLTLKSVSLPFILVAVIETAIFMNMGVAYYTNTSLPFVASIVIGTIQLGATIDYAILMSTTYLEERRKTKNKKVAMQHTLATTVPSIVVSALCFFAATIGVGMISKIDMIASICNLLSRGSIISMLVVILLLPSMLLLFDSIVLKTTKCMKEEKYEKV